MKSFGLLETWRYFERIALCTNSFAFDYSGVRIKRNILLGGAMKKDLKTIILTRKEHQIMEVVWARGNATVRDVYEAVSKSKPTAYTTILTLMGILEEKGVLAHRKSGRAYLYKPILSKRQATRNQVQDILVRFFDGRPEKLLESLLEEEMGFSEDVQILLESKRKSRVDRLFTRRGRRLETAG